MKTHTQLSTQIKANFVANTTLQEAYGLDPEQSYDQQFSAVSIESAIISLVAFTWYLLEQIMATFRTEIDTRIENAYLASIPWYYSKCLEYQHGYNLEFNPSTYRFEYATTVPDAKIVRFAAVRQVQDTVTKLQIYTNKEGKEPLTTDEHNAFMAYIAQVGAAGIHYQFINLPPDRLEITLQVIFNPLVLDSTGAKLTDGTYPVRQALQNYVDSITFGGMANRQHLVDAIQRAEGVADVILTSIYHAPHDGEFAEATGPNVISASGSFVIETITDTYTPNL
jgi:hypothetical protein